MSESPEWCQWAKQEIDKLKAERDELEAKAIALTRGLDEFGGHKVLCRAIGLYGDCNCGFYKALETHGVKEMSK